MMRQTKKILLGFMVAGALAAASFALAQTTVTEQTVSNDLLLSDEACRQLTAYQPGADGSADYKPGVDVTGKPVVEADLGGAAIPAPEVVEFDLTVDMAQYLGFNTGPRPEGHIHLGKISVLPDGRVLRNGAPMETQAEAALRALCQPEKAQ